MTAAVEAGGPPESGVPAPEGTGTQERRQTSKSDFTSVDDETEGDNTQIMDFAALVLDVLGHGDGEFTSLLYTKVLNGPGRSEVLDPRDTVSRATELADTQQAIWFGVNPIKGPARNGGGRGTNQDITRLTCLWGDIDIKPGACPTLDIALGVVAELSNILESRPTVIIYSGGGLQPIWPVSDGDDIDAARKILSRWGRVIQAVAANCNIKLDNVADPARVLRVIGSFNWKYGEPRLVTAVADTGRPLDLDEIAERLDDWGIDERPADSTDSTDSSGEPVSPPTEWNWAEKTCPYVAKMIAGFATDNPNGGRNPWLLSQRIRLLCTRRLGCITKKDWLAAEETLRRRFAEIVKNPEYGDPRDVKRLEHQDTGLCAIRKVAAKTDAETREELGDHNHPPPGCGDRELLPPPAAPLDVAREIYKRYTRDGHLTLRRWRGTFIKWSGTQWVENEAAALESRVYEILGDARYEKISTDSKGFTHCESMPWNPNRNKVIDVLRAMEAVGHLPAMTDAPGWLDDTNRDETLIACDNGLLDLATRTLKPHTPLYFNLIAVPFDYQADVEAPSQWLQFLHTLWPNDKDSIALLQEWFGYILSGRTHQQKAMFLYGPKRSGKSTIARILQKLIGTGNYAAPTLAGLAAEFGLQSLIGKSLAIIGDARLSSRSPTAVTERILSITGEDSLDVNRKFKDHWCGKLAARLLFLSNELPQLEDASGAIASRMLILAMRRSFFGEEDLDLERKLEAELPAILTWALDGLDRLDQRGRFTIPASSNETMQMLADLSSPIGAFIREECELGARDYTVSKDDLFFAWERWANTAGHKPRDKIVFGRDLTAAAHPGSSQIRVFYDEKVHRPNRVWHWTGIRLRKDDPEEAAQHPAQDQSPGGTGSGTGCNSSSERNAQDTQDVFDPLPKKEKQKEDMYEAEAPAFYPEHPVHFASDLGFDLVLDPVPALFDPVPDPVPASGWPACAICHCELLAAGSQTAGVCEGCRLVAARSRGEADAGEEATA